MSYEFDPNYPTPSITVEFYNDSALALNALDAATVGIVLYRKEGVGFAEAITLVDLADLNEPWQEGGFCPIGNMQYRLDLPASMTAVTAPTAYAVFRDQAGMHMSREEVRITREAAIKAKLDVIGSGSSIAISPVAPGGNPITINVGDDYTDESTQPIRIGLTGIDLTGATLIRFGVIDAKGDDLNDSPILCEDADCDVENPGTDSQIVVARPNRAATLTLEGLEGTERRYVIRVAFGASETELRTVKRATVRIERSLG